MGSNPIPSAIEKRIRGVSADFFVPFWRLYDHCRKRHGCCVHYTKNSGAYHRSHHLFCRAEPVSHSKPHHRRRHHRYFPSGAGPDGSALFPAHRGAEPALFLPGLQAPGRRTGGVIYLCHRSPFPFFLYL